MQEIKYPIQQWMTHGYRLQKVIISLKERLSLKERELITLQIENKYLTKDVASQEQRNQQRRAEDLELITIVMSFSGLEGRKRKRVEEDTK